MHLLVRHRIKNQHTMRTILLSTLATLATTAFAQLAPQQAAPLAAHLLEVNKEWRTMDPSPLGGDRIVRFDDDAQRIAMHLGMVREHLLAHTPEGLSAAQMHARTGLLDRLGDYAARGRFPQNHVLPYRNPVFIDPNGTACAVGQLMIESGDPTLALRISSEMNLAYVHDMHRSDVDEWAVTNGFSEDELAWIQPAYSPPTQWYALGGGTDGVVTTLRQLSNGDLLVAGEFTDAGGVSTTHVARWNGAYYLPMGAGLDGSPTCAVEFDGDIYVGGSFGAGYQDLAIWDGSTWTYANAFNGKFVGVNDLHVFNGALYAAGFSSGFAGFSHMVLQKAGGSWVPVGFAFDEAVLALNDHDGVLVCGGEFTQGVSPLDPLLAHVAMYNGSWLQLADGLDAPVRDLHRFNDKLLAAGDMRVDSVVTFGFADLSAGATTWQLQMPNQWGYTNYFDGACRINSIADAGGELFLGGYFVLYSGLSAGSGVARWSGVPDAFEAIAMVDAGVKVLSPWNTTLVMGGAFLTNSLAPVPYIGYTDLVSGIHEPGIGIEAALAPNPATDQLLVTLGRMPELNTTMEVLDATGRQVMGPRAVTAIELRLDVQDLASGTYLARLNAPAGSTVLPFTKR